MGKTIRAKVSRGVIQPLEDLDIDDGKEVTITIVETLYHYEKGDAIDKTTGGWVSHAEELKKNICSDRLISTRPIPKL